MSKGSSSKTEGSKGGSSSDEKRGGNANVPPKLAMPGSARGKAPSGASPAMPRPPTAPKMNSARGAKKGDGNPGGGGLGSARSKVPKQAPIPLASGGNIGSAPQAPSARASSAPLKPKSSGGGGRGRVEEPPEPEKPWGLVTAPIPPLPPNITRPAAPIISPAGMRPRGRQDGAPSRHDLAPPTGWTLLFNCFKAKFEIISGDASLVRNLPVRLPLSLHHAPMHLAQRIMPACPQAWRLIGG